VGTKDMCVSWSDDDVSSQFHYEWVQKTCVSCIDHNPKDVF
jgi:hypothetical protein